MSRGPRKTASGACPRERGFTLLEVLAAAMIFAMVVTVLIGTSSSAVHISGLTASRLEASAVAEAELARIEAVFNARGPLPESFEETRDRFAVRVFSEPGIDDFGGGAALGLGGALAALGGGGGQSGVAGLLSAVAPGVDQFLLRYEVRVEWLEGANPESIARTTYAFDWEGARAALPDLFQDPEAAEADAGDADDESGASPGPNTDLPQLPSFGDR